MYPDQATRDHITARLGGHQLKSGEATLSREWPFTAQGLGSGTCRFTYFTARKSEPINNVRMLSGNAASGLTLCRIGIYTAADNDDLTLIASTANDTTLFAVSGNTYTKALSAVWAKSEGQRYAFTLLTVGTTPATPYGVTSGLASEMAFTPRMAGSLTGQADLPATVTASALVAGSNRIYAALLP